LESNGNILLSEGFYHPTKIKFTVENRDLYNFQISHEKYYPITSILTRSYSGVFETYQAIHESEICKRLKISEQEFKKQIDEIQKFGILDVSWRSNLPSITFLIERLADADFSLKPEIYHNRKITAVDKANYILLFCEGEKCRAQLLISYFGQQTNECGKCDACLKKQKNKSLNEKELLDFLQKPTNIQEVKGYFRSDDDELNSILRKLVKEERVRYENGNYIAE
jgi:ATP-dependent DNA helicase RecQ